jgi:hypothetical protein
MLSSWYQSALRISDLLPLAGGLLEENGKVRDVFSLSERKTGRTSSFAE